MARNGSGVMTIVNAFVTDTTISSSAMNANFDDIASEITGSLPRDGQAAMTGQLKSASGTVAAPGVAFSSDTSMGFYRSGSGTMGIAVGGVKVGAITSAGILDANDSPFTSIPSGTVMLFAQTAAPTGWTKSTTHNDKALRVVSGTAGSGGSTAFTSVFAARTIARANLPNDTVTTGTESQTHTHSVTGVPAAGSSGTTGGGSISQNTTNYTTGNASVTHTHSFALNGGVTQTAVDFAVQYVDVILATKN
mgnify:FL=1